MANQGQASFAKRQREAAKRAKRAEKLLKRAARRSGTDGDVDVPEADGGAEPAEGASETSPLSATP